MHRAELGIPTSRGREPRSPRSRGRAFGIEVDASFAIPDLPGLGSAAAGPRTTLEPASTAVLRKAWPSEGVERLLERVLPDGRLGLIVEHHETVGFQIWAVRLGRHLVSPDGARVRCALPRISAWRWERLLFAQVLPLAAALQGRDLFHASAVVLDGAAIAFTGSSGAGKSSIAAHLVARGAALVTDDVLALDSAGETVIVHPGAGLAGIDARELSAMSAAGRARLGAQLGVADKPYLAVTVVDEPLPLRALYFITPGHGVETTIETGSEMTPRLLGSGFIAYLRLPGHLLEHLDVCARIARTVPTFEVSIPVRTGAPDVARAVETHARSLLG